MVDRWIEQLLPKQALVVFLVGVLIIGLCVSAIVLLATYSVWQAALAGLLAVIAILLACIARVMFLIVRMLRS